MLNLHWQLVLTSWRILEITTQSYYRDLPADEPPALSVPIPYYLKHPLTALAARGGDSFHGRGVTGFVGVVQGRVPVLSERFEALERLFIR